MMKKILYLIALFLPLNIFAIQNKFNYITPENGLSQGNIKFIFQDSKGFLWFGTFSGLNRFDGYKCKVFNYDPEDSLSLSHESVSRICEDSEEKFWIATAGGGISVFLPESGTFRRIQKVKTGGREVILRTITGIVKGSDGNIWALDENQGLFVFDEKLHIVKSFQYDPENSTSLPNLVYNDICVDSKGDIWVGAGNGTLCHLPKESDSFELFTFETRVAAIGDGIRSMYIDKFGKIWVGTTSQGAYCFDPETSTAVNYRKEDPVYHLTGNTVMAFCDDWDENMLIGIDGGGLNILNRKSGQTSSINYELGNLESLTTNAIYAIFIDRSETLWIGTYAGGICYQGRYRYKFRNYAPNPVNTNSLSYKNAKAIMEDRDGDIWIGTDGGGLNKFNPVLNTFKHYRANPENPNWLQTDVIIHMMQDKDGDIFIGSYNHGLTIFNKETETFKQYLPDETNPNSIAGMHPWYIFQDSYDQIWVGMLSVGLDKFDKATQSFTHYKANIDDPTRLFSPNIKVIFEDSQQTLWVGSEGGGLHRYNRNEDNFTRFMSDPTVKGSISNNDVRAIYEDTKGNIWIGTSSGLNLMHRDSLISFEVLTVDDGLPNNVINDILEDDKGNLWISTNHGMTRFNPEARTFRNYDLTDGLQGNEFNYTAAIKSSSGEFYFGGKNGFNVFRPVDIVDNPHKPSIVLTDFQLFNKSVDKIKVRIKGKKRYVNLSEVNKIKLSHKENVIGFEFSALDYGNPVKNKYKYKLEGFDKEWNEISSAKRYASYTNLKGGKYTFRVVGSNSDGLMNEEGLSIRLFVKPPIWQRWWFILLFVLIIGAIAYRYFSTRREANEREKEMLEAKIREGLSELEKQKKEVALKDKALQDKIESEKEQNWYNFGMNKMSEVMSRSKDDLFKLSQGIISQIVEYVEVAQGAIYLINDEKEEDRFLELMASYAPDDQRLTGSRFELEVGQLGACLMEQRVVKVDNLPEGYAHLTSGLGESPLKHMAIIPLRLNEITIGVIELLSFQEIPQYRIEFVEKAGETLTSILTSLKANKKTQKLLDAQKILAEEMAAQEEELRQNLEEMQATQEELGRMKEIERIKEEERREAEQNLMDQLKEQNETLVEKQAALQKEEYLFSALLTNAKESIYFKDRESKFIRISKSMLKLFKAKDFNEVIGKSDFDFWDDEHARPAFDGEQEIIKTGVPIIDLVEKEVHKDGTVGWVNTSKMPLIDHEGNVVGTWGISKDISESIAMEHEIKQRNEELLAQEEELRQNLEEMQTTQEEIQRMRENEQALTDQLKQQNDSLIEKQASLKREEYLFNALLDNAKECIYFKDKESKFIRLSKSMLDLFKKKDFKELLGKSDFDFFDDEHARPAYEGEQKIIKTGVPIIDLIEKEVHKDGTFGWVNTSKMPLFDQDGKIVGTWGISKNVTAIKQMEEAAQQSREKMVLYENVFETVINQMGGQVVVLDEEGKINAANNAFALSVKKKPDQLTGKFFLELIDSAKQKTMKQNFDLAKKKGTITWSEEEGKGNSRKEVRKQLVQVKIDEFGRNYYLLMEA